jgi:hypothetical protein
MVLLAGSQNDGEVRGGPYVTVSNNRTGCKHEMGAQ